LHEHPGGICEEEGGFLPRCSCPYAGTTRIRFEGLPRPIFPGRRRLSHLSGKLSPVRQGCGLMTEEAAPAVAKSGPIYWFTRRWKGALYPKSRQIRLEKRGGQLFDVQ
jgi:hypothetical protein